MQPTEILHLVVSLVDRRGHLANINDSRRRTKQRAVGAVVEVQDELELRKANSSQQV